MKAYKIKGRGGSTLKFNGECIASVEALNHDDTVRCIMHLYETNSDYVCLRIDRPETIDKRFRFERCKDSLSIYQFFGTEPLANYLYGVAGLVVPGLRKNT